jgi:hypothetical protein
MYIVVIGAEDVDPQQDSVSHRNCDIPLDQGFGRWFGDRDRHHHSPLELPQGIADRSGNESR